MLINKPKIFAQFPNLLFGLSTKSNHNESDYFQFNMSRSIGDNEETVLNNRKEFFEKFGLGVNNVIIQKQIHSDIVNVVEKFDENIEGDALITSATNLGLAISTADCTNIYLYDFRQKIISAVHSGWMGTEKRILEKTLAQLITEFNSDPNDIYAYFGPSICQENYEVGEEFQNKFDKKYLLSKGRKFLLDLKSANYDMLLNIGVPEAQIEISDICSFGDKEFHSYRRDSKSSGRALGVIVMRDFSEI
jgi:purine-nucleoside/S-methyl-5'-thioadenosine phosphorylase / adenosine deaminase